MILLSQALGILLLALILDALIGDPAWLWDRLPHPVVWMGRSISWLDARNNREDWPDDVRFMAGLVSIGALVLLWGLGAWALQMIVLRLPLGWLWLALMASTLIAMKSLVQHVLAVRDALRDDGLEGARTAVSRIVGRNVEMLDESAIARAAIESGAENFSDGVIAPAFWFALLGLPGLVIYKLVNTADSMIGHRSERYLMFGRAAARLDDALNYLPARLSGLLIAVAGLGVGGHPLANIAIMATDSRLHRSPNAGWPESAMAGTLGLALAGPRRYGAIVVDDPYLNASGRKEASEIDISRSVQVLVTAACVFGALVLLLALF